MPGWNCVRWRTTSWRSSAEPARKKFHDAYRARRCIVPAGGFFEWRAIRGQRAKQPYAIAMRDGGPFGIAGIWENWKDPASGEWIRTFAIITTNANEPSSRTGVEPAICRSI